MKYLKTIGLAVIGAMALPMFGAGTASATTLYAGTTKLETGTELKTSLKSKTSSVFSDTSGFVQNTCTTSTGSGKTTNETGTTITVSITARTTENCIRAMRVIGFGMLHISWTSGANGTVSDSGSEVEADTPTGFCIYGGGPGTHLGTLNGTTSPAGHASIVINTVVPLIETVSGTCPSDARWKAEYTVTSPTGFNVGA